MRNANGRAALWIGALALLVLMPAPRVEADRAESGETVEQIIEILREKGLIDEEEQERLLMKHAAEGAGTPPVGASILDGWEFYGDFRLRYELFSYRHDPYGQHRENRYGFRYRLRLGFEKELSDALSFGMRFTTGGTPSESVHRGANQTLGRQDDFDYDPFRINQAYIRWRLPETHGLETTLVAGKIANPFIWKHGKDAVIWDHDVSPEGGALLFRYPIDERSNLFANVGYFIDDENETDSDPKLIAAQLGGTTELGAVELGLRGSMYWWSSLDSAFVVRSEQFGNLPTAYQGGKSRIGDLTAFIGTELSADWPVAVFGRYARNFTADSGFCTGRNVSPIECAGAPFSGASSVGAEDDAWSLGLELGSSQIVKLGFSYFYIEANAVMSMFTDSDLLDGFTNRRGWVVYGGRQLTPNTEFKFAYYQSKYIERGGAFFRSTSFSPRSRLQTDIFFTF